MRPGAASVVQRTIALVFIAVSLRRVAAHDRHCVREHLLLHGLAVQNFLGDFNRHLALSFWILSDEHRDLLVLESADLRGRRIVSDELDAPNGSGLMQTRDGANRALIVRREDARTGCL